MLRIIGAAVLVAFAGASFSQTQPYQTTPGAAPPTPSAAPADKPAATPSPAPAIAPPQTSAVTPSETPSVTPSTGAPIVGGPAPVRGGIEERPLVGLSKCENLLAFEKEKCMQEERVAASAGAQPAGTGGTQYPAPAGAQNPSPTGTTNPAPTGTIR